MTTIAYPTGCVVPMISKSDHLERTDLVDQGCDLVILACNTAPTDALKRIKESWFPSKTRVVGCIYTDDLSPNLCWTNHPLMHA